MDPKGTQHIVRNFPTCSGVICVFLAGKVLAVGAAELAMRTFRLILGCASVAVLASACSGPTDGGVSSQRVDITEDALADDPAACETPSRYEAYLDEGPCETVWDYRGVWWAESLFPNAPKSVRETACAFTWEAYDGISAPDPTSFLETPNVLVTTSGCDAASDRLKVSSEEMSNQIPIMGGASGCDVCGRVKNRTLYAILPPEKVRLRRVTLQLVGGGVRTLMLGGDPNARTLVVKLPILPPGLSYKQGYTTIY